MKDKLFGNENALLPIAAKVNQGLELDLGYVLADLTSNTKSKVNSLAKLACILYKGNLGGVAYSAVVEDNDKANVLYISCAGNAPRLGWANKDDIVVVLNAALDYLNNRDVLKLFKTLAIKGNGLVIQHATDEQKRLNKLSKEENNPEAANQLKMQAKLFNTIKNKSYKGLNDQDFNEIPEGFGTLIESIINKIFEGVEKEIILSALDKTIEIVPWENEYYGVHVEAKAVYYALCTNNQANSFTVGLVSINEDRFKFAKEGYEEQPGCCTGCYTEFSILKNIKNFNISRIADYKNKFPPSKDYKPSPNINNDEILKAYAKEIFSIIDNNQDLLKVIGDQSIYNEAKQEFGFD